MRSGKTAATSRRFFVCALAIALAACASRKPPAVTAAMLPWQQLPISHYVPAFEGQPFDFRCGSCDIPDNSCHLLANTDRVVRVSGATQEVSKISSCSNANGHQSYFGCLAFLKLQFATVETIWSGPGDAPGEIGSVSAQFSFASHRDESKASGRIPTYLSPDRWYFLFLRRPARSAAEMSPPRSLVATCPRPESMEIFERVKRYLSGE